ncbi:MAG: helix-turn-helix domain-containing protein, partial [Planctomycetes bacterium]|nr:helix-turn-helix domain-containing protein [Planctomycetota bacterium]
MPTANPASDDLAILILGCAAWMNRDLERVVAFLDAQLRALMAALPRIPRLGREACRRIAELAHRIERARLDACARIVTVDTLRRWYRVLVARKWTHRHHGPGRPPIAPEIEQQIVTMARENPGWGVRGISQRLKLLGLPVSRATVRRVLRRNGIDPAPMRTHDDSWERFLAAHAHQIAAIDFTTVECFDRGDLTTQYCLFAIHHDT